MANIGGLATEDISKTIALEQTVFDKDGKKAGTVDFIDYDTGYFSVQAFPLPEKRDNPFADKTFYVPFRLITTIDPREMYLAVTRDELDRDYANPPARSTVVAQVDGGEVATTVQRSGYTGAPIVVERVRLDELKGRIAAGDQVYTSDMTDLGTIKRYDPVTGWMLVEQGVLWNKHDVMVPVTVVGDVNRETNEVYLVASGADLQRLQTGDPAYVVFVEATEHRDN